MRNLLGLALIYLAWSSTAFAGSICSYYRSEHPELYKVLCKNGSASTKPAGANSTFSDAFNINSGSLPTEPSSYGLETILSQIRNPPPNGEQKISPNFAIVKGFHKFGAGISTSGNNTFYGNDLPQRLSGPSEIDTFEPFETPRGGLTNLNIGTSLGLLSPQRGPAVTLGLSARYNKITDTWGGGPALLFAWRNVTLGAGFTKEKTSNFLPQTLFTSALASVRLSLFEVELIRLSDNTNLGLKPIYILTTTLTYKKLILSYAVRQLNYLEVGDVSQTHYSVQYLFSKSISAGFLFNYIPGTHSVGVQYFL